MHNSSIQKQHTRFDGKQAKKESNVYHDQRTIHAKCLSLCILGLKCHEFGIGAIVKQLQNTATTCSIWASWMYRYYTTPQYFSALQAFVLLLFSLFLLLLLSLLLLLMYWCVCVLCCVAWWTMTSLWLTHLESCDFFHDYTTPFHLNADFIMRDTQRRTLTHSQYSIEVCSIDSLMVCCT